MYTARDRSHYLLDDWLYQGVWHTSKFSMLSPSSFYIFPRIISRLNTNALSGGLVSCTVSAMSQSRVKVGVLLPLKDNEEINSSMSTLPIFLGANALGRKDLLIADKQVSRKHVNLNGLVDGSAEIVVEGQNPIILRSGTSRKKLRPQERGTLVNGDIVELIPGKYPFKYKVELDGKEMESPPAHFGEVDECFVSSTDKKESIEVENILLKRKRQVLEDEAFARTLQAIETEQAFGSSRGASSSMNKNNGDRSQICHKQEGDQTLKNEAMGNEVSEPIRYFKVPKEKLCSTFRLMRVQGLPSWANTGSVTIGDVVQGNVLVAILSNYMVDIDWLLSACPTLRTIPRVIVIHGESGSTLDYLMKVKPTNWLLYKPPLRLSYGTHHSKAMLLVYPSGVRVVVHTANLIYVDWNNKTQGLWMQDFPLKEKTSVGKTSPFEDDLVEYLEALEWPGCNATLPVIGDVKINAAYFRRFDYSSASVRLVASVPGYHKGSKLEKWGHMKLRTILQGECFEKQFQNSSLVYQFSSLGSLDEKWMAELASSMSSGSTFEKQPLGIGSVQIIWPTVEDVRCSLEGYAAGNAIPSPQKNVEKEFLKKYWSHWQADHTGRCRAMPHIKTYARYTGQSLAWFLLTSSNLSKAAWGSLQKNASQLMIRSYELGVIFLPSTVLKSGINFSCTDYNDLQQGRSDLGTRREDCRDVLARLTTLCWEGERNKNLSSEIVTLPVPYKLPPPPYTNEDVPWAWDKQYCKPDVYGERWPRHVKLYTNQDT